MKTPAASSDTDPWKSALPRAWLLLFVLGVIFALSSSVRALVPLLKVVISGELGLNNQSYAEVVASFMIPYTLAFLLVGSLIGKLGIRNAILFCTATLSVATYVNGSAQDQRHLMAGMLLLGLGQAGIVPSITVSIMTLFPARLHGFAYSVANSLQTTAYLLCPLFVSAVTQRFGWRACFTSLAVTGVVMMALWYATNRSQGEPLGDTQPTRLREAFATLWRQREVRILLIARLVSDPFWFFFQFWYPGFLQEHLGLSLSAVAKVAWIPPLVTMAAIHVFGVLSDRLVKKQYGLHASRLTPLFLSLIFVPASFALPLTSTPAWAIGLGSLSSSLCGVWLSLSAILMGSLVERRLAATALGLMSALGGATAIVFNLAAGAVLDRFGHLWPFWIGACLHPLAALLLFLRFQRRDLPART